MTSSKLILFFLGFILLIIVIISSNRIADSLRTRLGKYIPGIKVAKISPTPRPTIEAETPTSTPTIVYGKDKGEFARKDISTTKGGEIPATGPSEIVYIIMGGSLITGITLKKLTASTNRR